MARLTPEQRAELQRQLEEDAALADDFDVEIWDDSGKGGRVPYSKAKPWFQKTFGIDLDPEPEAAEPEKPKGKTAENVRPAHFGGQRRSAG